MFEFIKIQIIKRTDQHRDGRLGRDAADHIAEQFPFSMCIDRTINIDAAGADAIFSDMPAVFRRPPANRRPETGLDPLGIAAGAKEGIA